MVSRRLALSFLTCLVALCETGTSHAQEATPEAIYKQVVPSTMTLIVRTKSKESKMGTAFMGVKDNLAVTAWHVVRDAEQVTAKFADGEEFDVSGLVDKDEKRDVALIRVKAFGRPLLPFSAQTPEVGAKAYVIGAPKGLEFSLSDGLVSQVRQVGGIKNVQFTCAASPGNSGGPLVNSKGEAVGVVSWQTTEGQNLNFAIPVSYVLALDATLPTQPWDAVKVTEPSVANATTTGSKVDTDAFDKALAQVMMDSKDMFITIEQLNLIIHKRFGYEKGLPVSYYAVSDRATQHLSQLSAMIPPDRSRERQRNFAGEILFNALQGGQMLEKSIKAAQKQEGYSREVDEYLKQADAIIARKVDPLSQEDAKALFQSKTIADTLPIDEKIFFHFAQPSTKLTLGVVCFTNAPMTVVSLTKDSLGEKLGLKLSDVIQRVGANPVSSLDGLEVLLLNNAGQNITITVLRNGKEHTIDAKVPSDLPK